MPVNQDEMAVASRAARKWINGTGYGAYITDAALNQLVGVIVQAIDDLWASQKDTKKKSARPAAGDD